MKQETEKVLGFLQNLKKVEITGKGTDWTNIADLGKCLKENRLELSCKLQQYLSNEPDVFEIYEDSSRLVKVVYVREKAKVSAIPGKRDTNKYRLFDDSAVSVPHVAL